MYPFIRFFWGTWRARRMPRLDGPLDMHTSRHICMPWDIDMFAEMNNGRMLTLYDLGRFQLAARVGLIDALIRNGWALTIAGSSTRYRKRITAFQRFETRSRMICWDDRFMYLEQSMWTKGTCASHVLYRTAALEKGKVIAPSRVGEALGLDPTSPPMPDWVKAWTEAEAQRIWPPMDEG
ncbi:MAG: thioesterase family protein [Pseudomonadota bacterium]